MGFEHSISQKQLQLIQQAEQIALALDAAIQKGEISNDDTEKYQNKLSKIYKLIEDDEELLGKKFFIFYEAQALISWINDDKVEAEKLLKIAIVIKSDGELFTKSASDLAGSFSISFAGYGEDNPEIAKSLAAVRSAASSSKAMGVIFGIVALIYIILGSSVSVIIIIMATLYFVAGAKLSGLPEFSVVKIYLIVDLILSILSGFGLFPILMFIESIKALKTMKSYEIWSAKYRKD